MSPRRSAAAPLRAPVERIHDLELQVTELRAWSDGHEKRCEDRAEEFRDEAAGIRQEMAGMRRDIGRLVQNALDAKRDPLPLSEAEIARLVKEAVEEARPAAAADRSFLERALAIAQNLVTILGGLGAALLAAGMILSWLGRASLSAGAHLPPH